MNLPGCYLTERWGMAIFGWSDLSWRIFEYFLIAALAAGGMAIGGARRWFAGIFAVTFFLLMHGAEGPIFAVERDETMTVLLVAATALLFLALRRSDPFWMLPYGLIAGFEASIKPSGMLLDVSLLVLLFVVLRGRNVSSRLYLLSAVAGHVLSGLFIVGYFLHHHALRQFLFIVRTVLPSYGHTNTGTPWLLIRQFTPPELVPLIVLGVVLAVVRGGKIGWERWAIFLGMATGAVSYFAQRKGYPYHRYMFVVFTLLWIGWELTYATGAMRRRTQVLGVAGIAFLFVAIAPFYIHIMEQYRNGDDSPVELAVKLETDLTQLGGSSLQQQVQCMDLVNGCLNALYHLRLVGNTGSTGDMLLFAPQGGTAVDYYRSWFWQRDREHPADVVVLGNEWYQNGAPSFDKLNAWPQYADYLHRMYEPVVERSFGDDYDPAYRIYLRKGSSVLVREEANPLQ